MVVTSTGLRSTGGSLSQGFRSVRSCSALLFGDRAARYGVMVWSGVDVLGNFLPVVRGAVVYPGKKDHHKRVTTERPPYAQLKGSWSCTKNGKPLFHHVLQ